MVLVRDGRGKIPSGNSIILVLLDLFFVFSLTVLVSANVPNFIIYFIFLLFKIIDQKVIYFLRCALEL